MSDSSASLEGERLELRYIRLDTAVFWEDNPKQHDIGDLAVAIRRYGFQDPPKFDATLGALIYGNGRTHALTMMHSQHEPLPRGILRDDEGFWYLPVQFGLDLESQSVARAFAIDHNNLTMAGGEYSPLDMARMWEGGDYTTMLTTLAVDDMLPVTVDGDDLDLLAAYMLDEEASSEEGTAEEKALQNTPDELQEKWQVERGQIWEIPSRAGGYHRIMCGDSASVDDLNKLAEAKMIQGAVSSPPYAAQRAQEYGGVKADDYLDWWEGIQSNVRRVIADDGSFFVNIKAHSKDSERLIYVMEMVLAMKKRWGWAFVDEFCWLKPTVPGKFYYTFRNGFEPVYQFAVTPKKFKFRPDNVKHLSKEVPITRGPGHGEVDWTTQQGEGVDYLPQGAGDGLALPSNVFSFPHYEPARGHPAVFPVEVPEFFIKAYSDEGDLWFDPFVGSGSTIMAAERNRRLGLGMDLMPKYIAICLERFNEIDLEPSLIIE